MKQTGKVLLVLALVALAAPLAAAGSGLLAPAHEQPVTVAAARTLEYGSLARVLAGYYSKAEIDKGVYVGSEYCIACHRGGASWKETQHAFALVRPMTKWTMVAAKGVLADQNANGKDDFIDGLDLATVETFKKFGANAPKLSVENGTYYVTVSTMKMPVVWVRQWREADGTWLQRYGVRIPASDGVRGFVSAVYMSGLKYTTHGGWGLDGFENWFEASGNLKFTGGSTVAQVSAVAENFDARCSGCHVTGWKTYAKTDKGELTLRPYVAVLYASDDPTYLDWDGDGNFDLVNIGCESCHGPGSNHILYGGDKTLIVNPAKLTAAQKLDVCGQCHCRYKSLPNKTFSWPMNDATMEPWIPGGKPLTEVFAENGSYHPDGRNTRSTHMQFNEIQKSNHFTNPFHKVTCEECHDPHAKGHAPGQITESIYDAGTKLTIPTSVEDNTLCLGCHATHGPFEKVTKQMVAEYAKNEEAIGAVVVRHANHPYGPERSMGLGRCIECHQARTAVAPGGTALTVRGHTWDAIAPEKTLAYQDKGGMPNSCAAACHNTKVNSFGLGLDANPAKWNEAFDKTTAETLKGWYGPGGKWWNTTPK